MTGGSNGRRPVSAYVPCDGCTACCRGEQIILHPEDGDDPSQYETVPAKRSGGLDRIEEIYGLKYDGALALKQKPNGDCIYLGEKGCTIHDHRPAICRTFDCRKFVLKFPGRQLRALVKRGVLDKDMIEAGRRLLGRVK